MPQHPNDKCACALYLIQSGIMTKRQVATHLHIGYSTLTRWLSLDQSGSKAVPKTDKIKPAMIAKSRASKVGQPRYDDPSSDSVRLQQLEQDLLAALKEREVFKSVALLLARDLAAGPLMPSLKQSHMTDPS